MYAKNHCHDHVLLRKKYIKNEQEEKYLFASLDQRKKPPKTEMIKTGRRLKISNYLATRPINHNETGLLHAGFAFRDKSGA